MKTPFLSAIFSTVVVTFLAIGSSPANAQVCLAFTGFCDGLQLTVNGQNVTGTWQNTDCAGTDVPIVGRTGSFNNACGAPTNAVGCDPRRFPGGCVAGSNFWFNVDLPVDNTMDMTQGNYPNGTCWIQSLGYTLTFGACPFLSETAGQRPLTSTAE
jgi:hypothetical protein